MITVGEVVVELARTIGLLIKEKPLKDATAKSRVIKKTDIFFLIYIFFILWVVIKLILITIIQYFLLILLISKFHYQMQPLE